MTETQRTAIQAALGCLVRAEAVHGQPNQDVQDALRAALAEPVQDPVVTLFVGVGDSGVGLTFQPEPPAFQLAEGEHRLYASPQKAQSDDTLYLLRRLLSNQHTLTGTEFREELTKIVEDAHSAAPSDVPLLDDWDILGMWHATSSRVPMCNHYNHFARAIEQAVRQKAGLA